MSPEPLSERALNRALLARQGLLERLAGPLPRVVERVGGIQAQYAPSTYVGLWSRVRDLEREDVTRALERGSLLQGTLMRVTIHVVSKRDFGLFHAGLRGPLLEWWTRSHKLDAVDWDALARRVRAHLADGPLKAPELEERLAADGFPQTVSRAATLAVPLLRVPPSGTWERRRADLLSLAPDADAGEDEGIEHLLKRYLGAFGPASLNDAATFTGVPVTRLKPVAERLPLRRLGGLLDVRGAPLPDPETPAPVRFLPTWDATLLVHARRTQILPERYRHRVFHVRTPHSVSTFLVDGQVAGTWRHEGGRIRLDAFQRLSRDTRRELAGEAERLAAFHA